MVGAILSLAMTVGLAGEGRPVPVVNGVVTTGIVGRPTIDPMGRALSGLVVRLQKSGSAFDRQRAARELRRLSWNRHPEVAGAVAYSLLRDPNQGVRREAAETLAKSGSCGPEVHHALYRAATSDPGLLTRFWARRGLKSIGRRCEGECDVCQGAVPVLGPLSPGGGEVVIEGAPVMGAPIQPETTLEPIPSGAPAAGSPASAVPDEPTPRAVPGPGLDSSVRPKPRVGGDIDDLPPLDELGPVRAPEPAPVPPEARWERPKVRVRPAVLPGAPGRR